MLQLFPFNEATTELSQNQLSHQMPSYATYLEEETFYENLAKCLREVCNMMESH